MCPLSMRIVAAVHPTVTWGEGCCWATVFTIGRGNIPQKCVEKACSLFGAYSLIENEMNQILRGGWKFLPCKY